MKFTFHRVDRLSLALQNVDYKFLLIPVMFIVLRFWSFLGDVLNVFVDVQMPIWFARVLIVLEVSHDIVYWYYIYNNKRTLQV